MDNDSFGEAELIYTNIDKKSVGIYRHLWKGMIQEGKREERVHPTQKPVQLIGDIMTDYSDKKDIVIDLYAGSGSTLLAAEQTNRRCFMMELDPQYCQVIINRWEELTGKQHEVVKQVKTGCVHKKPIVHEIIVSCKKR